MKNFRTTLLAVSLATSLAFINAGPALAMDDRLLDPTSYKVADVVVGKESQLCANRSMSMKGKIRKPSETSSTNAGYYTDVEIGVTVYGPTGDYVGQDAVWFDNPAINKKKQTFSSKSNLYTCAHGHGYGRYTVGDAQLRYSSNGQTLFENMDISRSHYYVRGAAKSALKATRKGKYVTLSASASRYTLRQTTDSYGWVVASGSFKPYSAKKAKFQVKSGNKWTTLKTVTMKNGKANIKVKQSSKKQYRVTFAQTSTTTSATSPSVKK